MPKRQFRITPRMLQAGREAMLRARNEGGHTPETACRAIFQAMLDAADVHPGIRRRYGPPSALHGVSPHRTHSSVLLGGRRLPKTIWHPDRFPDDRLLRRDYWYLRDSSLPDLRRVLSDAEKVAQLRFWS